MPLWGSLWWFRLDGHEYTFDVSIDCNEASKQIQTAKMRNWLE